MTLVGAAWLADRLEDPGIRVLDVRWYLTDHDLGLRQYANAHLPGAVFLDLEDDLSDTARAGEGRHPLPDPHVLARRLGALGIGTGHTVVAYDHGPSAIAARAWWLLRHIGHPDVRVLDGGMTAWEAAGLPTTDLLPSHEPTTFEVRVREGDTASMAEVAARGDAVLLDARAPERYRGEVELVDPIPGHIPGAVNLPFDELVGVDQRLLDTDMLRARFAAAGVDERTATIASCGSGVTACHLILSAVAAGLPEPRLSPGSYSQWSRADMPVER